MKSMTGYGKGVASGNGRTLTIELRTVNNRFLELPSRIPKALLGCEDIVRRVLQTRLNRGTVELFADYENGAGEYRVRVDYALAAEYVRAARTLTERLGRDAVPGEYELSHLMRAPEVAKPEAVAEDPELVRRLTEAALSAAADALSAMRETEGAAVRADLSRLVDTIGAQLAEAEKRAPAVVAEYRDKLKARMTEILSGVQVDEARLLNEVAFFADKADINEEISRLKSHIAQFKACLDADGPQGRKLDFISQEMNREINTMGSKSNDAALTQTVIAMKNELEKIKEQIRNVE